LVKVDCTRPFPDRGLANIGKSLTNLGFARAFPDQPLLKIRISLINVDLPKEFIMFDMLNIGKTLGNLGFANSFIIDRRSKIGKTLGNVDSIKEFIMNGPVYPGPGRQPGEVQLATLQAASKQLPAQQTAAIISLADQAATVIDLDEDQTRAIIDQQLQDAGWLANTQNLRYGKGVRPARGQNMAIAEWPTANGIANYALFIGTSCIGFVEAKRRRKHVSAAIDQAERYARGFQAGDGFAAIDGGSWGEFYVPFVFATNGRPYLKQIETESGIWFRDVRQPTNRRRALAGWPTPEGLEAQLGMDREAAHAALRMQPYQFGFPLRPYQQRAIRKIEENLEQDSRNLLVAMATGTGKTKLAIALLYRLLTAKRFRRVCFVVDRSALGSQAAAEFRTTKVVTAKAFGDIFGLQGLGDITPESETKVHICTIQGLVKRVLYASEPETIPPIDQYDLLLIDECHRGYLLDREMSDAELSFRNQDDYVSKYRRVLEHFDAVKIGLTATPALHTVQIFGEPIFKYSYREAVVDGFLIDHEPPVQITTALSQAGIQFRAGEVIQDPAAGTGGFLVAADQLFLHAARSKAFVEETRGVNIFHIGK
jgi:type I restriction enzyme R subunit